MPNSTSVITYRSLAVASRFDVTEPCVQNSFPMAMRAQPTVSTSQMKLHCHYLTAIRKLFPTQQCCHYIIIFIVVHVFKNGFNYLKLFAYTVKKVYAGVKILENSE